MFNVRHATIDATGKIQISSFKMTTSKNDGFDTPKKVDKFLRSKLKTKGHHKHWKRYGSWTFTTDDGQSSFLFVWAASKGTHKHNYTYLLDDTHAVEVYDDLLLMRFAVDSNSVQLNNHLPISKDHVKEWLNCVLESDVSTVSPVTMLSTVPPLSKQHDLLVPLQHSIKKKKQRTQMLGDDGTNNDDDDENENSDDDGTLDVDEEDTAKNENILEDALDDNDNDNDKTLLLVEDDDDEESVDEELDSKLSDDEDAEFESVFDTDVLPYEEYTYSEHNKLVKPPLLLSLWTN